MSEEDLIKSELLIAFSPASYTPELIKIINKSPYSYVLDFILDGCLPEFVLRIYLRQLCSCLNYTHRLNGLSGNKMMCTKETILLLNEVFTSVTTNDDVKCYFAKSRIKIHDNDYFNEAAIRARNNMIDDLLKEI